MMYKIPAVFRVIGFFIAGVLFFGSFSCAAYAQEDISVEVYDHAAGNEQASLAYQDFLDARIDSGRRIFKWASWFYPLELRVLFSFESGHDIFQVIETIESYDLKLAGFHAATPGGSTGFSRDSDPYIEVEEYRKSMLQMCEVLISSFEEMAGDDNFSEAFKLDTQSQLRGFYALQSTLLKNESFDIIGADIAGTGSALRKFATENKTLARGIEVQLPGGGMSAIPPEE